MAFPDIMDYAVSGGPQLKSAITMDLWRDPQRVAYFIPATVAGRRFYTIADTGSPYFIIPDSLPCDPSQVCAPTGNRTSVAYGGGTTDMAIFTQSSASLGGNEFSSLVWGGSDRRRRTGPISRSSGWRPTPRPRLPPAVAVGGWADWSDPARDFSDEQKATLGWARVLIWVE